MQRIEHEFDGNKGSFFLEIEGKRLATMDYVMAGADLLIIEHTEVDNSLRGQGIGKKLLEKMVDYSRAKGVKVRPLCSFAVAVLSRKPEWQDILF
jgi:predicted GNAT family acetyltransferase